MKPILKLSVFLSVSIVLLTVVSCSSKKQETDVTEKETIETAKVELLQPENIITFPGELEGYYATNMFPRLNSYIKIIHWDIGDRVKAGQLLVELEAPEIESQLAESYSKMQSAEAKYVATKTNYKRLLQTNKTPGAVSANDIDYAKAYAISDSLQVVAASVHYDAAKQTASYLKITAPFDGVITDRQLAPGDFVGPGERSVVPILKMKDESKLRLHIAIPEKYVAEVEEGKEVHFTVKSFPNNTFAGKITRLSKNIDTKNRSEIIEILIDNTDGKLIPGMYATVSLPSKRTEKSLFVAETAVVTNMEKCFVLKVDANKVVHWVSVQKGNTSNGKTEIFGEIKEGDMVVKNGNDEIKEGFVIK